MMTISVKAAELIRDQLRQSQLSSPVIRLVQASDTPREVLEAVKLGVRGKELEKITNEALASTSKRLLAAVYPRSQFFWIFTTRIAGFPFASTLFHPSEARAAMKGGSLDVENQGLVLRDKEGVVVLPKAPHSAL